MNIGFLGMPGSGKSTIFHALTRQAISPQFLGYDLKPHHAVVKIPDARLDQLERLLSARSKVQATIDFIDIPGFDPKSTEKKLKNAVLEHYRKCDALALVIDMFSGVKDPVQQARSLLDELILLGLVTMESVLPRLEKIAAGKTDKEAPAKLAAMLKVQAGLEQGIPVSQVELSDEEARLVREYAFISEKPVIFLLNVADSDISTEPEKLPGFAELAAIASTYGTVPITISAAIEADLADMDDTEAAEYMAEFGIMEPSLPRFIHAAFSRLGLIVFYTGSEKEVRSWPLGQGLNAQSAAGVIHSDMQRGFIRAETTSYGDFIACGSFANAKAEGKLRLEGKEYIVKDGDILTFRFNV